MHLMFKLNLIIATSLLILTGCNGFFLQNNPRLVKQNVVQKPIQNKPIVIETKMIKGYVNSLKFTDNGWEYNIIGTDTTNNKLPKATAYAKKIYYNEKDLVYAVIKGDKITEMYLINKAQSQPSSIKKSNRSNKKIVLPLPQNEKISF